MSATDDGEDEAVPGREIAYRLFAAEYDDASLSYAESDEERAPNYVISPTGARLNRLFVVGTLTEVTSVNDEMVRARVVDPTGAFVVYAGQYQPDELATLEGLEPPAFVAVTGKARTFQPEDAEQVYTSIRPESIATVDADTRDRWVVSAAEQTLERVGAYAEAATSDARDEELTDTLREAGVEPGLAAGVALAQDHYGTTPDYLEALRDVAIEAVEVVADERDQVSGLSLAPDASVPDSDATFDSLAVDADVDLADLGSSVSDGPDTQPAQAAVSGTGEPETEAAGDTPVETDSFESDSAAGTATGTDREAPTAANAEIADALDAASQTESTSEDTASSAETADTAEPAEAIPSDAGATSDGTDATADVAKPQSEPEPEPEPEPDEPTATFDEPSEPSDPVDEDPDDLGDFDADTGMYEMDDEEREQLEAEFGAEFTTGTEVEEPGETDIDVPEPDETPAADDFETESEAAADAAATDDLAGADDTGAVDAVDDDLGAPPESGLEADTASEPTDSDDSEPAVTPDLEAEPSDVEDDVDDETADDPESESDAAADADDDESSEPAADVDLQSYVIETMEELDDGSGADRTALVETVAADTGADESAIEDAIEDALMGGQCYEPDDETLKAI